MRHVLGVLIGLVGAVVAVPLVGMGIGLAFRAQQYLEVGPERWTGALLVLVGGLVVGAVAVAGRVSATAPLTAAAVLLLLTAALLVDPFLLRELGLAVAPLSDATDLFVPAALAGVLLLAPLARRRPDRVRPAAMAAPPWPQPAPPPGWGPPPR